MFLRRLFEKPKVRMNFFLDLRSRTLRHTWNQDLWPESQVKLPACGRMHKTKFSPELSKCLCFRLTVGQHPWITTHLLSWWQVKRRPSLPSPPLPPPPSSLSPLHFILQIQAYHQHSAQLLPWAPRTLCPLLMQWYVCMYVCISWLCDVN
jgi:hypothetical protein